MSLFAAEPELLETILSFGVTGLAVVSLYLCSRVIMRLFQMIESVHNSGNSSSLIGVYTTVGFYIFISFLFSILSLIQQWNAESVGVHIGVMPTSAGNHQISVLTQSERTPLPLTEQMQIGNSQDIMIDLETMTDAIDAAREEAVAANQRAELEKQRAEGRLELLQQSLMPTIEGWTDSPSSNGPGAF